MTISMRSFADHGAREMLDELKRRFALCTGTATVTMDPMESRVNLRIVDSGGLAANASILMDDVERDLATEWQRVMCELADVFETPSHWMAL